MIPLPDDADFDLGASLGVPAVTAHRALTSGEDVTGSGPGRWPGGPCWWPVVQARSATPRSSSPGGPAPPWSPQSAATRRRRWPPPPEPTTSSTTGRRTRPAAILALAPDGVDLVVEVAPAQNNELDVAVVRNRGTVAIYANNGGDTFSIDIRPTFTQNLRYQFLLLYTLGPGPGRGGGRGHQRRDRGRRSAAGRRSTPAYPSTTSRSRDRSRAHDAVESGAIGKVLIDLE